MCIRDRGLSVTENNLTVRMRFTLVLTGEVQVDIRLLISLESKECLKDVYKRQVSVHQYAVSSSYSGRTDSLQPR